MNKREEDKLIKEAVGKLLEWDDEGCTIDQTTITLTSGAKAYITYDLELWIDDEMFTLNFKKSTRH